MNKPHSPHDKDKKTVVKHIDGVYRVEVPTPESRARRNPIHSVLTALPILMLVAGLYYYYRSEQAQQASPPIVAEAEIVAGIYTGHSVVKSGFTERHYLWYDNGEQPHGVRVTAKQADALKVLVKDQPVVLSVAPTVVGSTTLWAFRVEQGGEVLLDMTALTQD